MNHVEKIKKLLRLARDKAASPAEAASALNAATRLIEQHKIDVGMLDLDAETENIVRENIEIGARISLSKDLISGVVQHFFGVKVIVVTHTLLRRGWPVRSKQFAFVGLESDVTIAIYVYEFLVGACSRCQSAWAAGEKKARRKVTTNKKESFVRGWIYGVTRNLSPVEPPALEEGSRSALVLAARQQQLGVFLGQEFPNMRTVAPRKERRENPNALHQGVAAGRQTTVKTSLAGTAPEQMQLC